MDGLQVVARGVVIGLFVAAPPGPNAALCIRRTLRDGRLAGVRAGLGAASVHALLAGLAVGGTAGLSGWLVEHRPAARLLGGLVLVGLGVRLGRRRRPAGTASARDVPAVVVGLTNPLTLVTFGAAAAVGAAPPSSAPLTAAGVFTGSAAWWVVLTWAASTVGRRLSDAGARRVDQVSALALVAFGAAAVASAL